MQVAVHDSFHTAHSLAIGSFRDAGVQPYTALNSAGGDTVPAYFETSVLLRLAAITPWTLCSIVRCRSNSLPAFGRLASKCLEEFPQLCIDMEEELDVDVEMLNWEDCSILPHPQTFSPSFVLMPLPAGACGVLRRLVWLHLQGS